jgi:flagellar biosynthesis anti-sigma factor FlgM
MRIDPNLAMQQLPENGRPGTQPTTAGSGDGPISNLMGPDQTQLSGAHTHIQALVAQAAQMPEVRQARVESLRQALDSGNYCPGTDEVAAALILHMMVEPAVYRCWGEGRRRRWRAASLPPASRSSVSRQRPRCGLCRTMLRKKTQRAGHAGRSRMMMIRRKRPMCPLNRTTSRSTRSTAWLEP